MSEASLFSPGDVLDGRYRIVRSVGRGGAGEVYEALDLEDGGRKAIKTLLPEYVDSRKAPRRFERVLDYSRRINHRNVLRVYDLFQATVEPEPGSADVSVPCLVMELLEGETLADRLMRGETFSADEARPLVCQMAAGLTAAHRAGIVHRDLKPDNMFLVPEDGGTRVVLTDFGVAREARPARDEATRDTQLTASNVLLGTPTYMAPEQLELEQAMPASDVYTLGLVVFEMLTGHPPFEAETALKMVFKRIQEPAPSPRELCPDLDPRFEEMVLRCLERDPEKRFQSPQDIIRLLDGESSRFLTPANRLGRLLLVAAVAALVIGAVAGVIYLYFG